MLFESRLIFSATFLLFIVCMSPSSPATDDSPASIDGLFFASNLIDSGIDASEIFIAYCPERVLPGRIMLELVQNDRVIGGINAVSTKVVADFYRNFVQGEILKTEAKTDEM